MPSCFLNMRPRPRSLTYYFKDFLYNSFSAIISIMLQCIFAFLITNSHASFSTATPFYKSPESLFKSGETSLNSLKENTIGVDNNFKYLANVENKKIWLSEKELVTESETSRDKNNPNDLGYAVHLEEVSMRQTPNMNGKFIRRIPRLEKSEILGFTGNWVKLFYRGSIGYVELDTLITKFDFAYSVFTNNKWEFVSFKIGNKIQTKNNFSVLLSDIKKIATRSNMGVITDFKKINDVQLYKKQNVKIENFQKIKWYKSNIAEHGIVWWNDFKETSLASNVITTEELLQKKITAVSFHPKNSQIGIVSAGAIYKTYNGTHWKRLDELGPGDHSVAITENGTVFIGNFVSRDLGNTFESFLKWDKITPLIESTLGRPPQHVKILNIAELTQTGRLSFIIDTGYKKIKLLTDKYFLNYQVSASL